MIVDKAIKIKYLLLDVDGVLTNGLLFYGHHDEVTRAFHIHDGLGIKLLQKTGILIGIISAKKSDAVLKRLGDLDIQHIYLGYEKKLPAFLDFKETMQAEDHSIAYMGDDLPDLPLLKRAGLSITVPHAPEIIKQQVDYVTKKKAGKGAVREVCEFIMTAQDTFSTIINSYLNY